MPHVNRLVLMVIGKSYVYWCSTTTAAAAAAATTDVSAPPAPQNKGIQGLGIYHKHMQK